MAGLFFNPFGSGDDDKKPSYNYSAQGPKITNPRGGDVSSIVGNLGYEKGEVTPLWEDYSVPSLAPAFDPTAAALLDELAREELRHDWEQALADHEKEQAKKLGKLDGRSGAAQSEYSKAMAALASNYAIYERLMNASADDTSQDIKDLIDEAAQSEELAALEEASGYGLNYVNRGDIGTGIAGMDINPQGTYVSGDAAALLRLSQAESDLDQTDLANRQAASNDYINELAGLTGMIAEGRLSEADRARRIQEAEAQERLEKALAAIARRRAEIEADDGGLLSWGDTLAGYNQAKDWDDRRNAALSQADSEAALAAFINDLNSPSVQSSPELTAALVGIDNTEARMAADTLIGQGAANPWEMAMTPEQLARWYRDYSGS